MKNLFRFLVLSLICLVASCSQGSQKEERPKADSSAVSKIDSVYHYQLIYGEQAGLVGIYKVPEMLSLCILDSAHLSKMPQKVEAAYHALQADLSALAVPHPTVSGQIVYTSDSSNFKFECFQLINTLPKSQPKYSKPVVLEAEQMLVFNHYGLYQYLPNTYMAMLNYLQSHNLKQVGAFREYYVNDPTKEKDSKKWLTVVMLPVRK
ncbi:MAG: GyrI-like domain-containing protein [Bacteroidota bacterium]